MTNRNAAQGTYYENLFRREIAKDPQHIKKWLRRFQKLFRKTKK